MGGGERVKETDSEGGVANRSGQGWLGVVLQGALCHLFQRLALEPVKTIADLTYQVSSYIHYCSTYIRYHTVHIQHMYICIVLLCEFRFSGVAQVCRDAAGKLCCTLTL